MKRMLLIGMVAAIALVSAAPAVHASESTLRRSQIGQDEILERNRGRHYRHRRGPRWGGGVYFGYSPRPPRPVYRPYPYYNPYYYNPGYYHNPGVVVVPSPPVYYCR